MNERQAYALAYPLDEPDGDVGPYRRVEAQRDGNLLTSVLAVGLLDGVGSGREWWIWNPRRAIAHLRVGLTAAEQEQLPTARAVGDAGESGPERPRTRIRTRGRA